MEQFTVNTEKILNTSEEIAGTASRIRDLMQRIEGVKTGLYMQSGSRAEIDRTLKLILDRAADEAAKMDTMGEALEVIAEKYRQTERTILGEAGAFASAENAGANLSGTVRKWWQKFKDWWKSLTSDPYTDTTSAQEKAADDAMRSKLQGILSQKKYSAEHWDQASVAERKKILQDYMNEVIKIYDLKDVKTKINWDSNATYEDGRITWGYYTHDYHRVTLNERALSDSKGSWDSYHLLQTVAHELRHAYQHEAVDHPGRYQVSQETLDAWDYNFSHYIKSQDDYQGYRDQIIERDARSFEF